MEGRGNLVPPGKDVSGGLCIGCALLHHDYREILGRGPDEEYCSEKALPEAWIDGRRHRLCPDVTAVKTICRECKERALGSYVPA